MQDKARQGLIVVAILIVLIGIGTLASQAKKLSPRADTQAIPNVQAITYNGEDGKTVLELLERNHKVEKQDTPYGVFVRSIDGVTQTENSVWLPYVDGQALSESADKAQTSNGQTINWRYETF
jgi:hypothetical protein